MARVVWTEHQHPVVIAQNGALMQVPTHWLISLTTDGWKESYISDLAGRLLHWLSFLEERSIDAEEAIHDDIIEFRDAEAERVLPGTVNSKLQAVIQFYWWAQKKAFYRPTIVGWRDFYKPDQIYQIEVNAPKANSRNGTDYAIPFLLKVPSKGNPRLITKQQVGELMTSVRNRTENIRRKDADDAIMIHQRRNELMLRWASEGGLRRREVVSLQKSCVPGPQKGSYKKRVEVPITLGTKNSSPRTISVTSELINATNQYIMEERQDIVDQTKADPDSVFVTENGTKMTPGNLSKMVSRCDPGITPHDLRRYAIYRFACHKYLEERLLVKASGDRKKIDEDSIERALTGFAGHNDSGTTFKYYVSLARVATEGAAHLQTIDDEIDALEERIGLLKERKKEVTESM